MFFQSCTMISEWQISFVLANFSYLADYLLAKLRNDFPVAEGWSGVEKRLQNSRITEY